MPNPDAMVNWATQIRKPGTLLWCCEQLGQAEPPQLTVIFRVQKEREKTSQRDKGEICAYPSRSTQNNVALTLLSN